MQLTETSRGGGPDMVNPALLDHARKLLQISRQILDLTRAVHDATSAREARVPPDEPR